jgi:hypothetical protein
MELLTLYSVGLLTEDNPANEFSRRVFMPAIILWLMGVPLVVILLLYLIF